MRHAYNFTIAAARNVHVTENAHSQRKPHLQLTYTCCYYKCVIMATLTATDVMFMVIHCSSRRLYEHKVDLYKSYT